MIAQTPAPQQYREIPNFPDELEVIIANIECRLLESLTPQQFTMVQHLMEATRLLTEAELTLNKIPAAERLSA
ncbi:MAG: hypothetical protein IT306_23720 [Chloroflexi bacterium]|nr:hypothetical protein [Chloroflexota bacterium]